MDIKFVAPTAGLPAKAAVARIVFEGDAYEGPLARAVAASRFTGAKGQTLDIPAPEGLAGERLVLLGAGKRDAFNTLGAEHAAASAYNTVKATGLETLRVELSGSAELSAYAALGVRLASYRFDKYRTKEAADKKPSVVRAEITAVDTDAALAAFVPLAALADGISFTRDLVSEPPNVLFPVEFAARVKALETLGLEVEILGEPEMIKLGMGSLLAVGQGSIRESHLAVIKWYGAANKSDQPIAFVGKGVCFDTGGISIKPADGMEDMKWDMGGAGAVAGCMLALAGRKAKANVVGFCGLVENMPDGKAQRPGDVVTSMSGQTIEVINTDAEGRLVLCDVLTFVQKEYAPAAIVDLATLTGAIIASLGSEYAGIFANDETLAEGLLAAGQTSGDKLWRMPMGSAYDKLIDSPIADMKNVGPRNGGSITAAQFIQRYIDKGMAWAHLDIAGVVWADKPGATWDKGATGYGVRLLDRFVRDTLEK